MVRTYTRGTIVPFEEDIVHEFKGHRTISIENRMPLTKEWQNGKHGECLNTRQQWSKYLCGMLNSGQGGVLYGGILDNGEVNGFLMNEYQKLHVELQLDDVFGRFTPPVPKELYNVEFVPQIEPDQGEYVPDPVERNPYFWNLPHKMATFRRCWCDNDAAATHSLGIILPWYIIEVTIQRQEGTVYVAEDGEAYIRKHGTTEQLVTSERPILCVRCNKTGHMARECSEPPTFACHFCGNVGHSARECPERSPILCHKCYCSGHLAKYCPKIAVIDVDANTNAYCHWCETRGHFTRTCPERTEELRKEMANKEKFSESNFSDSAEEV